MNKLVAVLLFAATLANGTAQASDAPVQASPDLQLDSSFEPDRNLELIDAIMAAAPLPPDLKIDDPMIEPSAPGLDDSAWAQEIEPGVAYAVTESISLGLDYEHEEIEDLTSELIAMGTAGVDYTSYKVLVRAQFQFDLID